MVEKPAWWLPLIRLAIVAEGQTEAKFVRAVLDDHLRSHNVHSALVVMGGNVSVQRLAEFIARLYWSHDAVTSLVDFYGFKQKGGASADELELEIREQVRKIIRRGWDERKVFPYVQRHEFEALLFADVGAFLSIDVDEDGVGRLQRIRSQFDTPEDINDHHDTAPSKRISQVVQYSKVADGPVVAAEVGLAKMRSACPRFGAWLARLEALGTR